MDSRQVEEAMRGLGPVAKGSLTEVRKPCGRKGCRTCLEEGGHRAFLFHFADGTRRRCMYVPPDLAPALGEALRVGRLVEDALHAGGPALILAHRRRKAGGGA